MKLIPQPFMAAMLFALGGAIGCNDSGIDSGIRTPANTERKEAGTHLTSAPDFTDTYFDMVPYRRVRVEAYQIDAYSWRLEITVLRCVGDACLGTWFERVIRISSPYDPGFEEIVAEVLDDDSDGVWDWNEGNPPVPENQQ